MAQYDANILQTFADRLYAKAGWITFHCCLVGAIIGAALAFIPLTILEGRNTQAIIDRYKETGIGPDAPVPVPIQDASGSMIPGIVFVVGFLGAAIGFPVGRRKSFELRLQAQLTLCQMQTEFNTRQKPEKIA